MKITKADIKYYLLLFFVDMILILIFFIIFSNHSVYSSHFRFGQITWKPISDNGATVTVEFTAKWAWKRSYSSSYFCDQNTINAGTLIGTADLIKCDTGCTVMGEAIGNCYFQCTAFSVADDWTMGERIFQFTVPKTTDYEAAYTGSAWTALVTGGGAWEVRVKLDTTVRPDTGAINTSPVSSFPPLVCIRKGYQYKVTIPWADADNDFVKCRWANASLNECAGVCRTVPPSTLNGDKCELNFDSLLVTATLPAWFAGAIMLEDFKSINDTTPLSGVPLQFLIKVVSSTSSCTTSPMILGDRAAGACIAVPLGTTVNERIVGKLGCPTATLQDIQILGPTGTRKGPITQVAGTTDEYELTLTWTPIASQRGPNVICAKIIDTSCLSSDNYCFTLLAGITPPALVAGTGSPSGLLSGATLAGNNGVITWTVQFNKPVLRPVKSSNISVFYSNGTLLFKMDTSVFPTVTYDNYTLFFETGNSFEPGDYYILFDYGAGTGAEYCKAESDAVKDPTFWTFSIASTTTVSSTNTQPATIPGQTLGFSGLSSTVSPILPVGITPSPTTVSGQTTIATTIASTTTVLTTITTTTTATTSNVLNTTTVSSDLCTQSECNIESMALITTIMLSSTIGLHASSMTGVFLYLMKKKKAEEAEEELSPH